MEKWNKRGCGRTEFFARYHPALAAEQARLQVLSSFAERELPDQDRQEVDRHIRQCPACDRIVVELLEPAEIATAVCPSSESLDQFVFHRNLLSSIHSVKIEEHLQLCFLCREECEWLKRLEQAEPIAFREPSRNSMASVLVMAAALALAFTAFLFWKGTSPSLPAEQLKSLAVIKEPAEINYESLQNTSGALDSETRQQYEEGLRLFQQAKFAEAGSKFEEVRKRSPGHSASLFLLGYSYYKMDQPQKAFALCDQAENMRPHSYERCMFLVHIALKTGHFDRALSEITSLYHEEPEDPEIRRMYEQITALMPEKA